MDDKLVFNKPKKIQGGSFMANTSNNIEITFKKLEIFKIGSIKDKTFIELIIDNDEILQFIEYIDSINKNYLLNVDWFSRKINSQELDKFYLDTLVYSERLNKFILKCYINKDINIHTIKTEKHIDVFIRINGIKFNKYECSLQLVIFKVEKIHEELTITDLIKNQEKSVYVKYNSDSDSSEEEDSDVSDSDDCNEDEDEGEDAEDGDDNDCDDNDGDDNDGDDEVNVNEVKNELDDELNDDVKNDNDDDVTELESKKELLSKYYGEVEDFQNKLSNKKQLVNKISSEIRNLENR